MLSKNKNTISHARTVQIAILAGPDAFSSNVTYHKTHTERII